VLTERRKGKSLMKVLLVYPLHIRSFEQPLGVLYVSAVLKQHGHEIKLFKLSEQEDWNFEKEPSVVEKSFLDVVHHFNPGIIGISLLSTNFHRGQLFAEWVKKNTDIKIVLGGAGPTVEPEKMLSQSKADFLCVGEGEYAALDLVQALEERSDTTRIANIWSKRNGQILKNEVRPLVEDLDTIPFPDRELIRDEFENGNIEWTSFISSRGCPYQCSYCHNPYLQKLYRGKGRFTRIRSIEKIIEELKEVKSIYSVKRVTFSDDTFTIDPKRILEFCSFYAGEITLPFQCQTRANHVSKEIFRALKDAGCQEVHIGLEAGNDRQRNKVLKRDMSREQILTAISDAKEAGLKVATFNIIGAPYETEETVWDTIHLNRLAQPEAVYHTIFMPLTGSEAKDICVKEGWTIREINAGYYGAVFLEQPSISPRKLIAYQYVFDLYVYCPRWLYPIVHLLRFLWKTAPPTEDRRLLGRIQRTIANQGVNYLKKVFYLRSDWSYSDACKGRKKGINDFLHFPTSGERG